MATSPYVCKCGGKEFVRYSGSKAIYCKQCGVPVPQNVMFKSEYYSGKDSHVL
jgi:transcription initiation factor TFIIIB Brf1 subunit/transcription initiation factor TFIIB